MPSRIAFDSLNNTITSAGIFVAIFFFTRLIPGVNPTAACETTYFSTHRVHLFFYLWYGNPETDGSYKHWDHEVLPHWESRVNDRFANVIGTRHNPPMELHSPYYPLRGPYSSLNEATIRAQLKEVLRAGSEVVVVSWWGQRHKAYATDTQGVNTDEALSVLLEVTNRFNEEQLKVNSSCLLAGYQQNNEHCPGSVKIAIHLEPYPSRSVESVRDDLEYIHSRYGHHQSLYRMQLLSAPRSSTSNISSNLENTGRIVFYAYDSYHLDARQWRRLLTADGDLSIRGTEIDSVLIGLWLDAAHGRDLHIGGFDGAYSYFASDGFSYGSSSRNWASMCACCESVGMLCVLSVGPGYNDEGIRPWNSQNTKDRREGVYYKDMWLRAISAGADVISVTSFNEWGEGTQIEPAASNIYSSSISPLIHSPQPVENSENTIDNAERDTLKECSLATESDDTISSPTSSPSALLSSCTEPRMRSKRYLNYNVKEEEKGEEQQQSSDPYLYIDLTREMALRFVHINPTADVLSLR